MSLEPQSMAQRKLIAASRIAARHIPAPLPPAFFVTDPARTPDAETIASGLPAGFGVVYRHFGAGDRREIALGLAGLCQRRGLILLIAADPGLARAVGADGVHWPYRLRREASRWRRRFAVQTVSAHSARELRVAAQLPVDGALLSTVFGSRSASAGEPIGAVKFRSLVLKTQKPVFALGGVSAATAALVAGFGGFAAVDGLAAFGPEIRT